MARSYCHFCSKDVVGVAEPILTAPISPKRWVCRECGNDLYQLNHPPPQPIAPFAFSMKFGCWLGVLAGGPACMWLWSGANDDTAHTWVTYLAAYIIGVGLSLLFTAAFWLFEWYTA